MSLQRDPSHTFKGASDLKILIRNPSNVPLTSLICDSPWCVYCPASLNACLETELLFKTKKGQTLSGQISLTVGSYEDKISLKLEGQGPSVPADPLNLGDEVFRLEAIGNSGFSVTRLGVRPRIERLRNFRSELLVNQRIEPISVVLNAEIPGVAFSVSPALPAGIFLDVATGVISGVPRKIFAARNYQITARNEFSENSTTANLRVDLPVEEARRLVRTALGIFEKKLQVAEFGEALAEAVEYIDAETLEAPEVNARLKMESIKLANEAGRAKPIDSEETASLAFEIPGNCRNITDAMAVETTEILRLRLRGSTHHEAEISLHRPVRVTSDDHTLLVCEKLEVHSRSEISGIQIMGSVEICSGNPRFENVRFDGPVTVVRGTTASFRSCEFAGSVKVEGGAKATVKDSVFEAGAGQIDVEPEAHVDLVNNAVIMQWSCCVRVR